MTSSGLVQYSEQTMPRKQVSSSFCLYPYLIHSFIDQQKNLHPILSHVETDNNRSWNCPSVHPSLRAAGGIQLFQQHLVAFSCEKGRVNRTILDVTSWNTLIHYYTFKTRCQLQAHLFWHSFHQLVSCYTISFICKNKSINNW